MLDRGRLWNAVQGREKRKDSQLARELEFALPQELSIEKNIGLSKDFVIGVFVSEGMVADLNIHSRKDRSGIERLHAHVILTMRKVCGDGFGPKERAWNTKDKHLYWRRCWAEYANRYLELSGVNQRIDHRSYEELGIDIIPQNKVGPEYHKRVYGIKREEQEYIACENEEKIVKDQKIILKLMAHKYVSFSDQELEKFIRGYILDEEVIQAVYEQIKASAYILSIGKDGSGLERFRVVLKD
jgi:ATP-dependent exoDNAse (exonuclease V) alpha subunit